MKSSLLTAKDFPEFFKDLWGPNCDPFPWQQSLALQLCEGKAPGYIAVPTGCGKTACLDAAIFALAVQAGLPIAERTQGRRIFFIVNRRVIVDEAYERAGRLVGRLRNAPAESVAGRVAMALRTISGNAEAPPLARVQLRGGIFRDRSWAGSLLQPMIICSTVDQAGSRLLFRGYGVSPQAWPIHAALVAQDSLLLLDEAHISRPFVQTLEWVQRYRSHQPPGCNTVQLPFHLIQMTATPPVDAHTDQKTGLTSQDYEHPVLKPRLTCSKPASLVIEPKAKGKMRDGQMASRLVEETVKILSEDRPRSIAIMVNRVATARAVAADLEKSHAGRVKLLIGRLRPLDREATTRELQERLKTGANPASAESAPLIVVSTQCLEVGADLDFDALVTEAASLDALRQRFGRLNRGGREIPARAVIILPADQNLPRNALDQSAPCDPIYGNAIPATWAWLVDLAQNGVVDFCTSTMGANIEAYRKDCGEDAFASMLSPTTDAPTMLPAYLDCWVQTNPPPAADPDVALFIHGPQREMAEVQVCWRGDLPASASEKDWADILSLCPPAGAECLPVPIHIFRAWLDSRGTLVDTSSDVPEIQQPPGKKVTEQDSSISAFVWRSQDDRFFARRASDLLPGDTIILRAQDGGWGVLGNVPGAPTDPQTSPDHLLSLRELLRMDIAERANAATRRIATFRVHPALLPKSLPGSAASALIKLAQDPQKDWLVEEVKNLLMLLVSGQESGWEPEPDQRMAIEHLAGKGIRLSVDSYPDNQGFVISSRQLLPQSDYEENGILDTDALLEANQPQELFSHTQDVMDQLEQTLNILPLAAWHDPLVTAASAHDWGKADPRFQALLCGTTPFAAMSGVRLLAKSASIPSSSIARRAARKRAELPDGFRHEMLSVKLAEKSLAMSTVSMPPIDQALVLHLIATHHGYGRPFAPVVVDPSPPDIVMPATTGIVTVTGSERLEQPAHALDSGIAERFWLLNRHCGWWGLALLESVLRLADQAASAHPQEQRKP